MSSRNEIAKTNEIVDLSSEPLMNFVHSFKGFGVHPSKCRVKIWRKASKYLILFIDLGMGTSVTNASEQLVEELTIYCLKTFANSPYFPQHEDLFFAEGYEGANEGIDLVIPTWRNGRVVCVDWRHITKVDLLS